MIKKIFWEQLANLWAEKEVIEIPDIDLGEDIPPDDLEEEGIDFEGLDDFL